MRARLGGLTISLPDLLECPFMLVILLKLEVLGRAVEIADGKS